MQNRAETIWRANGANRLMRLAFPFTETRKMIVFGGIVIAAFVLITFYPATKIGFYGDDWWEIADAGRKSLLEYLRSYFDPGTPIWLRPVHGILLFGEYYLFGPNAEGYHFIQILLHLANSLLLFVIVGLASRRWQLGFVSALLYAGFFPGSTAVHYIAVHDPLATVFYLLTVLLWLNYLRTGWSWYFWLAFGSFVLALFSKETSAALIVTLFLVDRILVGRNSGFRDLFRRYSILSIAFLAYLAIEFRFQFFANFPNRPGYGLGFHIIDNSLRYLRLLAWPWDGDQILASGALILILVLLIGAFLKYSHVHIRGSVFLLLGIQAILFIAPVLGFQGIFFEPRYLYAASMVPAILIAVLVIKAWTSLPKRRLFIAAFSTGIVLLVMLHSASTVNAAVTMSESNRELRVPFRDIVQQHLTYPPDTYLYFINSPYILKHFAPSMFFFRYGQNVTIGDVAPEWWGTVPEAEFADLRAHKNSFVYYYDDSAQRHEFPVDQATKVSANSVLPVTFQKGIQLEGYEISRAKLNRTDTLVVLLYWQTKAMVDRDYTVFVHLVDKEGRQIAGEDSQPQYGYAPTTSWKIGKLTVDPHILNIVDAPVGQDYHLEVGLYYLPTMERVGISGEAGQAVTDTLTIAPFTVVN